MKKLLLSSVAVVALASAANAADMPVKAGPMVAPGYNWTGFYIGGSLAAALYDPSVDPVGPFAFDGYVSSPRTNTKLGWGAGVQAGYNWQIRRAVLGVEVDYTWLSANSSFDSEHVDSGANTAQITAKADGLFTARGRFGFDVMDGLLIYGTAGVGWLHAKYNYNASTISGGAPKGGDFASSKWSPAFVSGGGVEYMISGNWSLKAEVLWVKPQTVSANARDTHYFDSSGPVKYNADLYLAKWGVNYRF